jgi:ribosomal protein L11 methylase PrmA
VAERNESSFRDPSGHVYESGGRIFRTITERAVDEYRFARDSGLLQSLADRGLLISADEISLAEAELDDIADVVLAVEHPRLPFISYPYEWPFPALKAAALLHLDLNMELVAQGMTLSDATAFNVQFRGSKPVFIDLLSLRRYREGEYWAGYRQYCDQFLNPLLLRALTGIPHNAWYRGSPEGIAASDIVRLLPWRKKISPRIFAHVGMQSKLQGVDVTRDKAKTLKSGKLSKTAYLGILHQLRGWIASLKPAGSGATVWQDYVDSHSYTNEEQQEKKAFIGDFAMAVQPGMLWDFGCNTGEFSEVALAAGAGTVIGFDFDQGALDAAFERSRGRNLNFLPLFQDATNPSPDQGWKQRERDGLAGRRNADALLALALVHHLAIGKNVPLPDVVDWLVGMAPHGVVEFVPKDDPMIQRMLMLREDIFDGYDYDLFTGHLRTQARVVREQKVSQSGRMLIWYERLR